MSTDISELQRALDGLPRFPLANLPTPLEHAERLSDALGGPTIYIKRDDLTGMPLAGNKTRMFENILPKILSSGADCVIGGAPIQSNYCRQLTAACTRAGLDIYLVLMRGWGDDGSRPQGNFLLDLLMGARVFLVDFPAEADPGGKMDLVADQMRRLADTLREDGRSPYLARVANTEDLGLDAASYVRCALELHRQLEEQDLSPDYLYITSADTSQGGLLIGAKVLRETYQVVGINMIDSTIFKEAIPERVANAANKAATALGLDININPEEVNNDSNYVGDGYAIPTEGGLEAIDLLARYEAIMLDPVYSSKGMAGLIDHIRQGNIGSDDTVVYLHTGGYPALFAFREHFDFKGQISHLQL